MSQTIPTTGGRLNPAALPADLRRELAQLDRRLRWVSFVRGVGSLMFVVLLMAALFLGTDYYFPLPGVIRFAFLTLLCVTGLWLFYQWLVLPLTRRRRWPDLAYIIDRAFPDFQERVSSTVELSMLEHGDSAVSEYMTERLRQETNTRLTHVDLWECLSLRTMAIALVSATLLSIVAAVPLLLNSQGYSLLWQRLLTPWVNLDSATNLTFLVEDADRTVPRGSDAMIYAEPHWRYYEGELPREIRLQWTDEHGKTQSREMAYDAGRNAFVGKIPQLMSPVNYVLSSRNARSRTYHINVADRPRIVDVQLTIQPPAYTQVPESIIEGAIGTIRVIEGSRLIANLKFEHPVAEAAWMWKTPRLVSPAESASKNADSASQPATVAQSQVPATLLEEGRAARFDLIATQSDQFAFLVTSGDGLTNIDEPQRLIQIVPDRAPRIDMTGSNDPVKVQPADVVPIEIRADDDFGLVDVRIVVEQLSRAGEEPQILEWSSPKTGDDVRLLNDSYELNLSQFELESGDILGYRAVARDGRPIPGPNETWTSRRVLMLDEEVKTIAGQEVEEFYESLRRHADIVKNEIAAHRRELESDRKQLDPKPREESKQRVDEKKPEWMQTKLALNLQLDDLSRRLQQRPITRALSQMNVEPAQQLIDDTARALEEFKPVSDNDAMELIRDQETDVREAEKSIDRLMNQLRDAERIEQELTELQQLARRAKELAKDAANLNDSEQKPEASSEPQQTEQPDQPQPLEKLQSEWSTLSQDLENLLKRRPELKQAAKNALLSELSEVAETADELARLQSALGEATRDDQQALTEASQPLAENLRQAREIASELAQRSSEEARDDAAPVFNPTATREAAHEQEQANFGNAAEQIQAAREALERFQESMKQTESLPTDAQQAATELAKRSAALAEEMKAHHDEQRKLEGEARAVAGEEKKLEGARKANPDDPALTEKAEQLDARKQDLSEQERALEKEQQKLSERLAGVMQAASALPTTPQFEPQKRDAVAKLDQGADELAARTDRADDRVRDASKTLENLARSMGDKPARDQRALNQLKPIQEQAEQLARELEDKASQSEPAGPQTGPDLAPRQLEQLRSALRSDTAEQEGKLAEAVKTGLEANEQLKSNDLKKAAETQKKFAEQLAELNKELAEPSADTEQNNDQTEEDSKNASGQDAWRDVPLSPELKALRFPQKQGEPEQLKAELEKLVKSQQELNEKTEKAIADNAAPERANELRNKLRQLAGEQRNLAEQSKSLNGESAALPRMTAQQLQRESQKALESNQPEQATESQQQAKRQLEEALDQVSRELEDQHAAQEGEQQPEKSRSEELAEALRNQLDKLSGQMEQPAGQVAGNEAPEEVDDPEGAPMAQAMPDEQKPSEAAEGPPAESGSEQPPAGNMPNEELLQNLKNSLQSLQASQERLAAQAEQLAEQSEVMSPEKEELNETFQAAAESARKASEQLQSGQLRQSEPQAQQASEKLAAVAEQGLTDESAQKAVEELAEQQQQIAEQLQELAQNPQASQLARAMSQQQLQEQTEGLAEAFKTLSEQSKADPIADQRNSQQLSAMQNQSQQAAGEMQNAQQQSQQGNLQNSGEASDKAAETLKRLAKESAQLANTKRDTLVPEPVGEDAAQASRLLDQAEESLKQAMQQASQQQAEQSQNGAPSEQSPQQGSPSQQQAANAEGSPQTPGQPSENSGQPAPSQNPSALQQLAQQLAQAAQALDRAHESLQPPQENSQGADQQQMAAQASAGQPSETSDSTTGNQTPMAGDEKMDGSVLRSALMRDWGQRQEELDADLTDARRRPIDQQYAPLIRSYFESLAQPEPAATEE
ncbi:DUF4175 family protein [Rubinisphaera margarita]|uniref:DUF4175 family protein n=1 Tax=Rubinisphaera margarita TaxID=2909586 RepID=UPI001EE98150|nr:DUF4175 family protein [Rubinisphaera margarita]MCG6157234.1 hypothetical protein [Rubinisphaera margarita]